MIKVLVMDVDGTLTDGKIYMGDSGEMMKAFNIKDGYGIHDMLPTEGITPVIITGRISKITENRCKELGITELYQGIHNKTGQLRDVLEKMNISFSDVAYIGDDMNDYSCMQQIKAEGGIVGCPCDAVGEVKKVADFISEYPGGNGAVRDMIEWLISSKK